MENNCIFCKIVEGKIPGKKVFENEHVIAFEDINPQAPVHILIIPRKHIKSLDTMTADEMYLLGEIAASCQQLARKLDMESYRLVTNVGADAGQSVFHLHFHLLGKRIFRWPPG